MLTMADDYPVHQRPEPIARPGSNRDFYDRYFFNGCAPEGQQFFALALGVYPNRNVMDASFCVIHDGIQHNLRASRRCTGERMDIRVGPISIEVLEPLRSLRILVDDDESGMKADLTFTARAVALEEPRFTRELGPGLLMDYTRLTQNGSYRGTVEVKGVRLDVRPEVWMGTRDRSWGIRPVGKRDESAGRQDVMLQFYWLWAPVNFEDCITLYDLNADEKGEPWHTHGVIAPVGGGPPETMAAVSSRLCFRSGTRHADSAEITFRRKNGEDLVLQFEPLYQFYMSGLGYLHPEWGHGMDRGEQAVAYDTIDLGTVDEAAPLCLHVQAVSRVRMGGRQGLGFLEQLILGPHEPSGFKDLFDMTP
jgi:hypothetical protein